MSVCTGGCIVLQGLLRNTATLNRTNGGSKPIQCREPQSRAVRWSRLVWRSPKGRGAGTHTSPCHGAPMHRAGRTGHELALAKGSWRKALPWRHVGELLTVMVLGGEMGWGDGNTHPVGLGCPCPPEPVVRSLGLGGGGGGQSRRKQLHHGSALQGLGLGRACCHGYRPAPRRSRRAIRPRPRSGSSPWGAGFRGCTTRGHTVPTMPRARARDGGSLPEVSVHFRR